MRISLHGINPILKNHRDKIPTSYILINFKVRFFWEKFEPLKINVVTFVNSVQFIPKECLRDKNTKKI